MLTVVSVLFDGRDAEHGNIPPFSAGKYGPEWADRLYRGIKRHLRQPFRFVCLVDREYKFAEPVEQVRLEQPSEGWMAINEVFRPDLGIERGLFMGLDSVITGSLDDLAAFSGSLGVPRDPIHPRLPCNAVVSFDAAAADFLWTEWNRDRWHWRRECMFMGHPSEMVFLRKLWPRPDFHYLDDTLPDQFVSYKCHLRPRGMSRNNIGIAARVEAQPAGPIGGVVDVGGEAGTDISLKSRSTGDAEITFTVKVSANMREVADTTSRDA